MSTKVLVIDDESDVRTLCRVNLEYEGYEVVEAEDGQAGLDLISKAPPDVILLDLMMPRLDGWQVLERLKQDERTAQIPVILLTAKNDEESQLRGWGAGIIEYVTKPFNPLVLSRYIQKALNDNDRQDAKRRSQIIIDEFNRRRELRKKEEGGDGT